MFPISEGPGTALAFHTGCSPFPAMSEESVTFSNAVRTQIAKLGHKAELVHGDRGASTSVAAVTSCHSQTRNIIRHEEASKNGQQGCLSASGGP